MSKRAAASHKDEPLGVAEMVRILSPAPSLTDEMVERAARALHEVSDDVFPFDLPSPGDLGLRSANAKLDRFIQRRERYQTTARAALEAALGGAA